MEWERGEISAFFIQEFGPPLISSRTLVVICSVLGCIYQMEGTSHLQVLKEASSPSPRKIVINSHLVPRSSRKSFFYGHHKPPIPSVNELRISLPQCRESLRSKAVSVKGSGDLSFYFMEMMKLCKVSPGSTYFFKYGTYCMCVPACQQRSQHHRRQGCEWLCLE